MGKEKAVSEKLTKILIGGVGVFLGNIIGASSKFLIRIISARHLGPTDYGVLVLGITILHILSIPLLLGLPSGLAREIPTSEDVTQLFHSSTFLVVPVSIIVASLGVFFSGEISALFSSSGDKYVFVIFLSLLPLYTFTRLVIGLVRGLKVTIGKILIYDICFQGVGAVAVVIGTILGANLVGITLSWATGILISTIMGVFWVYHIEDAILIRVSNPLANIDYSTVKSLVFFSFPLMVSQGLWIMLQHTDNFLIGIYLESTEVGIYDAAFTIAQVLMMIISSISFLFLPIFSEIYASGKLEELDSLYKLTTKWIVFITTPVFIILVLYSSQILRIFFGPDYVSAALILKALAVGFFGHVLFGLSGYTLTATGRTKTVMFGNMISIAVNLSINIILIPTLGALGAALAFSTSYFVSNVFWVFRLKTRVGVQPFYKSYVYPTILSMMAGFGLLYSVSKPQIDLISNAGIIGLYLAVHIGIIVMALESQDREMIHRLHSQVTALMDH